MKKSLQNLALSALLVLGITSTAIASGPHGNSTGKAVSVGITQGKVVNPGETVALSIQSPEAAQAQAVVTNGKGAKLLSMPVELAQGSNLVRFHLSDIKPGLYFLQLQVGKDTQTRTFYVQ